MLLEITEKNCPRKCFWPKEKETQVKFNLGLSANRPSNSWAQKVICSTLIALAYPYFQMRGWGGGWDKGGPSSKKNFFRPFGPQCGLKIKEGSPSLDTPLYWECSDFFYRTSWVTDWKSSFLAFFVILKSYEALGLFYLKLTANGLNNSQHCWPNKAGSCCVRLHVAKRLTGLKLCAATPNNMQQGVQTDACANGRNV